MKRKIVDLEIDKIALVDSPANKCKFFLYKAEYFGKEEKSELSKLGAMISSANMKVLEEAYEILGNLIEKAKRIAQQKSNQNTQIDYSAPFLLETICQANKVLDSVLEKGGN